MSQTTEKIHWTIHDLEVLPQNEWIRHEIVAGELLVTRTPHRRHQQVCFKIAQQIEACPECRELGETIIAPGVVFSEADNVVPDVVWVSKARLAQIEDDAGHLTAAPELVVEVLSPGKKKQQRDREAKLKLYSLQGVQEYWLCDRFLKQVEVYRREGARLVLVATLLENDSITSPLLPGLNTAVNNFFFN